MPTPVGFKLALNSLQDHLQLILRGCASGVSNAHMASLRNVSDILQSLIDETEEEGFNDATGYRRNERIQ